MKLFRLMLLLICAVVVAIAPVPFSGQTVNTASSRSKEIKELRQELANINARLTKLENEETSASTEDIASGEDAAALRAASVSLTAKQKAEPLQVLSSTDRSTLDFFNGTTINIGVRWLLRL